VTVTIARSAPITSRTTTAPRIVAVRALLHIAHNSNAVGPRDATRPSANPPARTGETGQRRGGQQAAYLTMLGMIEVTTLFT
jgi:hypothetical protein